MSEKRDGLFSRAEEVLSLFRRGAEFTQDLIKENERLRVQVAEFEARSSRRRTTSSGRSCATSCSRASRISKARSRTCSSG